MVKWPSTQLKYYELPLQQWIYLCGWWGTVWLIDHSWGYLSSLRVDIVSSWGLVFMNYTHGESADVYFFSLAAAKYPLCMIDRQYMSHFSPLHCSLLVIQTHLSVMVVKWWRVIRQTKMNNASQYVWLSQCWLLSEWTKVLLLKGKYVQRSSFTLSEGKYTYLQPPPIQFEFNVALHPKVIKR